MSLCRNSPTSDGRIRAAACAARPASPIPFDPECRRNRASTRIRASAAASPRLRAEAGPLLADLMSRIRSSRNIAARGRLIRQRRRRSVIDHNQLEIRIALVEYRSEAFDEPRDSIKSRNDDVDAHAAVVHGGRPRHGRQTSRSDSSFAAVDRVPVSRRSAKQAAER